MSCTSALMSDSRFVFQSQNKLQQPTLFAVLQKQLKTA